MKPFGTRFLSLTLVVLLTGSLSGCTKEVGSTSADDGTRPKTSSVPATPTPAPTPVPTQDLELAVQTYWSDDQLTQAWGPNQVVEHLFFHPVITYPEYAFTITSASEAAGLDDWMVTADEYNKILQSLYENDYILVRIEDVWSEQPNENGEVRMVRNTLMLPEGKKPLVFSYDDTNYYDYMLEQGFTWKLIVGDDGDIWSYAKEPVMGQDPSTWKEVISQDQDAITILDQFIRQHPDFSLNGAKGCLSLTGYMGILGYRTQNDIDIAADDPRRAAFDANRAAEIASVKPVIARLKETGWTFGSHTWGHIRLSNKSMEYIQRDTLRWAEEVGSLVGPTNVLFYPHGARPDGDRDQGKEVGPQFAWLQSQGFRIFASVGINSFSAIKSNISAVICDRLHPDGTTLRNARSRYLQFYDAKDILDLNVRPVLPYNFEA